MMPRSITSRFRSPASANVVLISEENWRSIQETLHLLAIPGMRESIRHEMRESLKKSFRVPGW